MNSLSVVTNGYITSDRIVIRESGPIILYGKLEGVMQKHYVGEIGKTIIIDCKVDISAASAQSIEVKKPDGTLHSWVAEIYTIGGASNYLKYVTITGNLDQAGLYEIQGKVTLGTFTGRGETNRFEVYELFD